MKISDVMRAVREIQRMPAPALTLFATEQGISALEKRFGAARTPGATVIPSISGTPVLNLPSPYRGEWHVVAEDKDHRWVFGLDGKGKVFHHPAPDPLLEALTGKALLPRFGDGYC